MNKLWTILLMASLLLAGCISVAPVTGTPTAPPRFVTSTLPPTKALVLPSTATPSTPDANPTVTGTVTVVGTSPPDCKVQAVLLEDVTIPDDTRVTAGESFTKTWRFKNTGTCHWKGYTINFLAGDRMGAPDSAPVPDTLAGSTVDVSVDLTAPTADGSYSGYFTLKNADGESINVGTEKSFWVKIIVGNGTTSATPTPKGTSTSTSGSTTDDGVADCNFSQNAGIVSQISALINNERQSKGLPALIVNSFLATAAQKHSADMACHNLLSHTGSDGSYVSTRIAATGYSASYTEEIIYAGGDPQTAFDWWMSDTLHRNAILSTKSSEMGVGYAFLSSSSYGGYITVDFASP
jgi:uncharacterized protein YkwD